MRTFELTANILADLPKTGPSDPIEFYHRRWVGKLYVERINRGLRMLGDRPVARALEVGYGAGAVQLALIDRVHELHGIDLDADPQALSAFLAERHRKPRLVQGTVYELPYANDFFDLVVSFSVFEHLHDFGRALREVNRVLRPGGEFLLGMPAVNRMMEAAFFAIGYKNIDDMHVTTPKKVMDLFETTGFRQVNASMLDFPLPAPFGVRLYYSWLLQKD